MRVHFGLIATLLALGVVAAGAAAPNPEGQANEIDAPAGAAAPGEAGLRGEIDTLLRKLETSSHGFVKWDGADRIEIRRDGDVEIADIVNARLSIDPHSDHPAHLTADHLSIRRVPRPDNTVSLGLTLPQQLGLRRRRGEETTLTLKEGAASATLDAHTGRAKEATLAFAGAGIDDKTTGDRISFGPLSFSSKLAADGHGGWSGPIDFALKDIAFSFNEGPVSGAIDAVGYHALTAGPDLAALIRVREKLDALQANADIPEPERVDELLDLLPKLYALFSVAKGELSVDGVVVRGKDGQPLVNLAQAGLSGAVTGLSGDAAAWRVTLKHDGLKLAPSVVDPARVPRRVVVDFGVEDLATASLRAVVAAASKMRRGPAGTDNPQAMAEMFAALATLKPVARLYDLSVETQDAGISAQAKARGSPLAADGYAAEGDVSVRGFDALSELVGDNGSAPYLAVLKEIGTAGSAADGTPRLDFHIASTPAKRLSVNGSDLTAWLAGSGGGARLLRPAAPAMTGEDVRAVQRALADAGVATPRSGVYDAATARAVARFQKRNGLNVDGVVDAATLRKLGIGAASPGPPGSPSPGKASN